MNVGEIRTQLTADMRQMQKTMERAERELKQYEDAVDKQLDKADRRFDKHGRTVGSVTSKFNVLRSAIAGVGGAVAAMGIGMATRELAQAGIRAQNTAIAFRETAGSVQAAREELSYIHGLASELGLSMRSLEDSFLKTSAAAKGTALEGEALRTIFRGMSEASTVLGLSAEQTSGALNAVSQMISKGNVQAEELRGQLGERLPGAFQMAAKSMGVTTQELNKMLEDGEVLASDLLPRLGRYLHERFGQPAKEAADTARASFERMTNNWEKLLRSMADQQFMNQMKSSMDEISETISDPDFQAGMRVLAHQMGNFISTVSGGIGAVGDFVGYLAEINKYVPDEPLSQTEKQLKAVNSQLEEAKFKLESMKQVEEKGAIGRWWSGTSQQEDIAAQQEKVNKLKQKAAELNEKLADSSDKAGDAADKTAEAEENAANKMKDKNKEAEKQDKELQKIAKQAADSAISIDSLAQAEDRLQQKQRARDMAPPSIGSDNIAYAKQYADELDRVAKLTREMAAGRGIGPAARGADDQETLNRLKEMNEEGEKFQDLQLQIDPDNSNLDSINSMVAAMEDLNKVTRAENASINDQLTAYSNLFGAMKQGFDEGSKARERLHQLEMTFAAIEIAMEAKKMIAKAATAVTNALGSLPFPANMAAAAVTAAGAAAALSSAGVSWGWSGGGGGAQTESAFEGGEKAWGAGGKSKSFSESWDMLKEYNELQYDELTGIRKEMEDLNQNISGVSRSFTRMTAEVAKGKGFSINTESMWSEVDNFLSSKYGSAFTSMGPGAITQEGVNEKLGLGGNKWAEGYQLTTTIGSGGIPSDWVGSIVEWIGEGILGGEKEIKEAGLKIGDVTIRQLQEGINTSVEQYAKVKTEGGWFGSDSTDIKTREASQAVSNQINAMLQNMGDTLLTFADQLGVSTERVRNYTFDLEKLDLKGKTGEDRTKAISNWLSNTFDAALDDVMGDFLNKYRKMGEDLMKTATRLITGISVVNTALEKTGREMDVTGKQAVEFSQELIKAAGGMEKLAEDVNAYFDEFATQQQKLEFRRGNLETLFQDTARLSVDQIPKTKEEMRNLVDSLDMTSKKGREAWTALMTHSDAIAKYIDTLKDANSAYMDELQEPLQEAKSVLQDVIDREEELINARKNAAKSLDDLQASLMGGEKAPVQSRAWYEQRYEKLLGRAESAEKPGEIQEAVGDYRSFAQEYLGFMGDYGGNYRKQFQSVMGDIEGLQKEISPEQKQVDLLDDAKSLLENNKELPDIKTAIENYQDVAWMDAELDRLKGIEENTGDLVNKMALYLGTGGKLGKEAKENYTQALSSFFNNIGYTFQGTSDWTGEKVRTAITEGLGLSISEHFRQYASPTSPYGRSGEIEPYIMGSRQYGGPVEPGGSYVVGEAGPEILHTGTSGRVEDNETLKQSVAEAVSQALGGSSQPIYVTVRVGERELNDIHVEQHRYDDEVHEAVRREAQ